MIAPPLLARRFSVLLALVLLIVSSASAQDSVDDLPSADLPRPITSPAQRKGSNWTGRAEFIRSHWVRLQPNGDLVGSIALLAPDNGTSGADDLRVSVYQQGQLKGEARTDANGQFTVSGLEPGVYALVARGSKGFVAYGLTLVNSLRDARADHIRLVQAIDIGETLTLTTAAVPPTFNQLRQILEQNYSKIRSNFVPPGEYTALLEAAEDAAEALGAEQRTMEQSLYGIDELRTKSTDADETKAATTVRVHPVVLEEGPRGFVMRGRLYGIDPDSGRSVNVEANSTTVFLIQNDKRVATTMVGDEGAFDFFGIDEGIYSLVAIGESGFGAVSFRAVRPAADQAQRKDDLIRFVQLENPQLQPMPGAIGAGGTALPFAMALIDDPEAIWQGVSSRAGDGLVEQVQGDATAGEIVGASPLQPQAPPPSSTPPTSTTSGSFSSGGGGLPIGALVGAAAIATAIPLAVTNRDSTPQLMSPFSPGLQSSPPPPTTDTDFYSESL